MAQEKTPNPEKEQKNQQAAEKPEVKEQSADAASKAKAEKEKDQSADTASEAKAEKEKDQSANNADEAKTEKKEDSDDTAAKAKAKQEKAGTTAAKAKAARAKPADAEAKAAKKKKEKPPAVEDKPFTEFIPQHFIPALKEALAGKGIEDIDLTFTQDKISAPGSSPEDRCWQVVGSWNNGQRQFNVYFLDEDIKGQKAFSYATNRAKPSTIESWMIDERKVTLDLLVLYTLQRLNGQKWLTRN